LDQSHVSDQLGHPFKVRVRSVKPEELDRLKDIRLRALLDAPGAFGSRYDDERHEGPEAWQPWVLNGTTFVVEDGLAWLGLVAVFLDGNDRSVCHLVSMWTDPLHRGKGLGRRLLQAGLGWAQDNDAATVVLGVVENNSAAEALYRSTGFRPTGRREPLRSNSSKTVVYMELPTAHLELSGNRAANLRCDAHE
jgi:ribosomal protein S18 acetylase RimI-like enzyme